MGSASAQQTPNRTTIFVSPKGTNNDGDCGAESAPCSLGAAAVKTKKNDKAVFVIYLIVDEGSYHVDEVADMSSMGSVSVEPVPGATARAELVYNGADLANLPLVLSVYSKDRVSVRGLVFIGFPATALSVGGDNSTHVEDCHFRDNSREGFSRSAGLVIWTQANATVVGCSFVNNTVYSSKELLRANLPYVGAAMMWHWETEGVDTIPFVQLDFRDNYFESTLPEKRVVVQQHFNFSSF